MAKIQKKGHNIIIKNIVIHKVIKNGWRESCKIRCRSVCY